MGKTRVKIVISSYSYNLFEKDINRAIKNLEDCDATIKDIKLTTRGCSFGNDEYVAMIIYEVN